jgi:hypothetical protein
MASYTSPPELEVSLTVTFICVVSCSTFAFAFNIKGIPRQHTTINVFLIIKFGIEFDTSIKVDFIKIGQQR